MSIYLTRSQYEELVAFLDKENLICNPNAKPCEVSVIITGDILSKRTIEQISSGKNEYITGGGADGTEREPAG